MSKNDSMTFFVFIYLFIAFFGIDGLRFTPLPVFFNSQIRKHISHDRIVILNCNSPTFRVYSAPRSAADLQSECELPSSDPNNKHQFSHLKHALGSNNMTTFRTGLHQFIATGDCSKTDIAHQLTTLLPLFHKFRHLDSLNDIVNDIQNLKLKLDLNFYTAVMSAYLSGKRYEDALRVFEFIQSKNMLLDQVAFIGGVRASGFARNWKYTLRILEDAIDILGPSQVLEVVHAAMINEKYRTHASSGPLKIEETDVNINNDAPPLHRIKSLIDWMDRKKIYPVSKTMTGYITRCGMCKSFLRRYGNYLLQNVKLRHSTNNFHNKYIARQMCFGWKPYRSHVHIKSSKVVQHQSRRWYL